MWFFDLVEFVSGKLPVILLALAVGLAIGCVVAPHQSEAARRASIDAEINPLWLLAPFGALFFTSPLGADMVGDWILAVLSVIPPTIWELMQIACFIVQAVISVRVIRGFRSWPWLAWPLTVVLALMAGVVIVLDLAMMVGPMVK